MSNLPFVKMQCLDNNGDPVASGLLYAYEAGTTTPYNTYSDEALTSANANPVVADSNGRFGEVYLDPNQSYKLVMKSADGATTYWTGDNINAVQLASDSVVTRLLQVASNPVHYGAVGDGVADESSEVQDAIDNATGVVDLLGKTYRCDSMITLAAGITLRNGTLDFSNAGSLSAGVYTGGSLATPVALSGDAAIAATSITVADGSGFAAGDWIIVESDADWHTANGYDVAEVVQIKSKAGTTLNLVQPLEYAHATLSNAQATKINTVANVVIEDVRIVCNSATVFSAALFADHCEDLTIRNVKITAPYAAGIYLRRCVNASVEDCTVFNGAASGSKGIQLGESCEYITLRGNSVALCDYGIYADTTTTGAVVRYVDIVNNKLQGVSYGIHALTGCDKINIVGNTVIGDTSANVGILAQCLDVVVDRNLVRGFTGHAISLNAVINYTGHQPWRQVVRDNDIRGCVDGINVSNSAVKLEALVIEGNVINDCTSEGIIIVPDDASDDYEQISIRNNIIDGAGSDAISLVATNGAINRVAITDNTIVAPTEKGIDIGTTTATLGNLLVANNVIGGVLASKTAISIVETSGTISETVVADNEIDSDVAMADGVVVSGISNANVTGNRIISAAGDRGIVATSCSQIVIAENNINGFTGASGHAISTEACTHMVVADNILQGCDVGFYGNSTGASEGHTISGNMFDTCAIGISYVGTSTLTGLAVVGNSIMSASGAGGYCITIVPTGGGVVSGVVIMGNICRRDDDLAENIIGSYGGGTGYVYAGNSLSNGTYGISHAAGTVARHFGNTIEGMATASTTGTFDADDVSLVHCRIGAALPAPSGSDQLNQDRYLFTAPCACKIVGARLISGTATSGSDASNHYQFNIYNGVQAVELLASNISTNGSELVAGTPRAMTPDQNQQTANNDTIYLRTDIYDNGGAGPTDLSGAVIMVEVEFTEA